jgi:hypothetical protein
MDLREVGLECMGYIRLANGDVCEHSSEQSKSMDDGEFLDHTSKYPVLQKDSEPWN